MNRIPALLFFLFTTSFVYNEQISAIRPGHYYYAVNLDRHAGIEMLELKKDFSFTYVKRLTSIYHHKYKGAWRVSNDTLWLHVQKGKMDIDRDAWKLTCPCTDTLKRHHCKTVALFVHNDSLFSWKTGSGNYGGGFTYSDK